MKKITSLAVSALLALSMLFALCSCTLNYRQKHFTFQGLTITLTEEVDAVGLYAVAYANSKDVGKYLTVNGVDTSAGLLAAESYDGNSDGQRFLVELDEPSSEVTISAKNASNNRFYLYSIGFYFA